jgi:hypothetical protein
VSDEMQELEALYAEAEADGLFVKEWDGMACVGEISKIEALLAKSTLPKDKVPSVAEFVKVMSLGDVATAGLGWPGGGDTRAARVRDGMEKARDARKPWQERFPGAPSEDFFPFAEPFEEKGYTFFAWQPSGDGAPRHFVLQAKKDGEVVREVTVPMDYPNQWGVDVADVQSLEAATETLIGELP